MFLEVANRNIGSPAVGEHTLSTHCAMWQEKPWLAALRKWELHILPCLLLCNSRRSLLSEASLCLHLDEKTVLCLFFPFLPMDGSKELFTSQAPNHWPYDECTKLHFKKMQDIGSVHNSQQG